MKNDILYPEEIKKNHINYLLKKLESKNRIIIKNNEVGGYLDGFYYHYPKNILIIK